MFAKTFLCIAFVLAGAFSGPLAMAADPLPTVNEIFQAAQGGRFIEAQAMMDKVLLAQPNSAKAHFVQAELFAKQGMLSQASSELARADSIQPGLASIKPDAVQKLRAVIAAPRPTQLSNAAAPRISADESSAGSNRAVQARNTSAPAPAERGLPWGMLLIGGLGLVAFVMLVTRFMNRRNAVTTPMNNGMAYAGNGAMQPAGAGGFGGGGMGTGMGGGGIMQQPQAGGGLGAGLMGGLATGVAVGAGVVAGQALMHHFTDGDRNSAPSGSQNSGNNANDNSWAPAPQNDLGGNNFGVSDSSSWDSGGSDGGGSDGGGDW